jgi:hypothetical protein
MAWCIRARLASTSTSAWQAAKSPPTIGRWGAHSHLYLEADTPSGHKVPCCVCLRLPPPFIYFVPVFVIMKERRKGKVESVEVCSAVRNLPRVT